MSATERIMSMKNSNDTIGNRIRDLPACSAVTQPTAPPAACPMIIITIKIGKKYNKFSSRVFLQNELVT
jgi:hypothetical protein